MRRKRQALSSYSIFSYPNNEYIFFVFIAGPLITKEERANGEAKFVQVGVTSWGIGCGQEGYPGVYSRVTKGLEWIKNVISDNDAVITIT